MRTIKNRKLSTNFNLYEFIEAQMPVEAVILNWKNISEFQITEYIKLAQVLENVRKSINTEFQNRNAGVEIGIKITSGFRCRDWELIRKRSGESQHCVGAAADIQPTNCTAELAVEILKWLHKYYNKDYAGGLAIKHCSRDKKKNITAIGFVHLDVRTNKARWTY